MSPAALSFSQKRWLEPDHIDTGDIAMFLAKQRNLTAPDAASFTPTSMFADMPQAVDRIATAINNKEKICIFGDYDCDGITATAQLVRYFRRHDIEPTVRLPHREHDGYGLQMHIVEECKQQGIQLLITVDTGIASATEIEAAQAAGIDVIVTDHHYAPEVIPSAVALIHPALNPKYPLPHPSGAGVAFQLIRALEGQHWDDMQTDVCLAMIGTVADIVELRGDNRTLVQIGLNAAPEASTALQALFAACDLDPKTIRSTDIAFRVAPRINASGRLDSPLIALHALLGDSDALQEMCDLNKQRQQATEELIDQARAELNLNETAIDQMPLLIAHKSADYTHGLIGLIAGRLCEDTGRPTVIANDHDGVITASLRSPAAFHITEALVRCDDLLDRYGGHAQAAGCTLSSDNWNAFCAKLTSMITDQCSAEELRPTVRIDAQLDPADISMTLTDQLQQLEPYGQGNTEPVFLLENVVIEDPDAMGNNQQHLRGRINGQRIVGWNLAHLISQLNQPVDIACRIGSNTWNNKTTVQLTVVDIRAAVI